MMWDPGNALKREGVHCASYEQVATTLKLAARQCCGLERRLRWAYPSQTKLG